MSNNRHENYELLQYQSLPLDAKIRMSMNRIRGWYEHFNGNVYVSYSGGKDSTVLLHLVRSMYPEVPAVFSDTGLEYPEIRRFAMSQENVTVVRPNMRFPQVLREYGYPVISKEVAEAIYYSRRIGGGRTAQRKQREMSGRRLIEDEPIYSANGSGYWNETQTHRDISGQEQTDRPTRTNVRGGAGKETYFKRGEFFGRRLGTGVTKSQFNKDKYLPIVYMPFPISHYCCNVFKKLPLKRYQHKNHLYPFIGSLACESQIRRQAWLRHGCNAFESANPTSQPLSFWLEQDILEYIETYHLPICSVYGDIVPEEGQMSLDDQIKLKCTGCQRTGCIFCGFGAHIDKERFTRLRSTHPQLYRYCIGGGMWADNPAYVPDAPEYDGEWKNWNPEKIWVPSLSGLGMGRVFDMLNDVYGKDFIPYE